MELREQFPTMTEIRNLEYVGFSGEEIANLLRIQSAAISEVPITRPLLSISDWRLCAGSTSGVACKAKP